MNQDTKDYSKLVEIKEENGFWYVFRKEDNKKILNWHCFLSSEEVDKALKIK